MSKEAKIGGFETQSRVIHALIIREMMMRYGRSNIGFLWVILEPMILTIGVMLIWSVAKSPYEHGIHVVSIVMTGYMPLTLFRHMANGSVHIYRRSISFLYHRHISFCDVLIARSILEFAGTTSALLIVYVVLVLASIAAPIADPALALGGWLSMAALSFGFAAFLAAITELSDTMERFVQPFQYLLVPLSGCFFMLEWIPKSAQNILWYMPFVHCYEMFRAGFFGEGITTYWTWWYPIVWSIILTTIGLSTIEISRDKIHTG